jgi:hypothetical protein
MGRKLPLAVRPAQYLLPGALQNFPGLESQGGSTKSNVVLMKGAGQVSTKPWELRRAQVTFQFLLEPQVFKAPYFS